MWVLREILYFIFIKRVLQLFSLKSLQIFFLMAPSSSVSERGHRPEADGSPHWVLSLESAFFGHMCTGLSGFNWHTFEREELCVP